MTTSINPEYAVPLEFAAILSTGQRFHCFFHHEYVPIKISDAQRLKHVHGRMQGQRQMATSAFAKHFLEFLKDSNFPTHIFTIAGKMMQQVTYPIVYALLGDSVRWSYSHFDVCALHATDTDEFIPSWQKLLTDLDIKEPKTAMEEAMIIQKLMETP